MNSNLLFIFKNKYFNSDDIIYMKSLNSQLSIKCTCNKDNCYHISYLVQKFRNNFYNHESILDDDFINIIPIDNNNSIIVTFYDKNKYHNIQIRLNYNNFYFCCDCQKTENENYVHDCEHLRSFINYIYNFYDPINNTIKKINNDNLINSELNELSFDMKNLSI